MKASDLTPENRFFALFVGASGTGKTVAEASFEEAAPPEISNAVEIWDFDQRVRGLLGAPLINRNRITYEVFPPREEGMVNRLNSKLETMLTSAKIGQPLPHTIVLDSLTSETFAMVCQAMPLTHKQGAKGKFIGNVAMAGPEDYGFEAQTTYSIMSFLRSIPVKNVIVSAHIVSKYGKANPDDPFSANVVIGEQLSVRDKIGENVQIYFDHCFRFYKRESGGQEKYFVKFRGDLPLKTSYAELASGEVDITGKSFYKELMKCIQKDQKKEKVA